MRQRGIDWIISRNMALKLRLSEINTSVTDCSVMVVFSLKHYKGIIILQGFYISTVDVSEVVFTLLYILAAMYLQVLSSE